MFHRASLVVLAIFVFHSSELWAENWPQWRGPYQNGVVADRAAPTRWGETKNVVWKLPLPGWGTSTPAIWGADIFLTGDDAGQNVLICVGRDGEKKWQLAIGSSAGNRNRKASGSNPSPVTDGAHVYAYFRSGDLACVDFHGEIIWQTNLQESFGPDRLNWDLGTSPVLTEDLLVVAVMHQGPSYLVAFDRTSGQVAWKHDRDLGAPAESRDSYTTPLVVEEGGAEALVVLGADHVTAHLAETGEEIWRVGDLNPGQRGNWRSIASAVAAPELVIAPYARGNSLTAIRRGGRGDVTNTHVAWTAEVAADVPSPVAYDGRVYICGDRGDVTCIELASGETLWSERLPRNRYPFSSSPVIADGKLYLTREDGTTFVLRLDGQPRLIATNELLENTYATPVFVDGQLYLRTSDYLFRIEEK